MAETIKTVLTADSTELRAEFGKAAAVAQSYHQKMEEQSKRALQGMRGQLDVLRLEARGHTEAAEALKQKMSLEEQARKFALQAGVTEETALQILTRKVELEREIVAYKQAQADAAARQSAFEKSLTNPAQGRAAEFATMERERAAIAAQQAAMERAAADAAAARQTRIDQMPSRGWQGLPGGLAPLTPQSLSLMEKHAALTRELRRGQLQAGRAGMDGSLGILAFSQAVEDAQYGIKGVLNNIPQMVLGFGGGAGIAGVVSLAVVSLYAYYKAVEKVSGAAEMKARTEANTKAMDDYAESIQGVMKKHREANREEATRISLQQQLERELRGLDSSVTVDERRLKALEDQSAAVATQVRLAGELRKAREGLKPESQRREGVVAAEVDGARIMAEMEAAQKRMTVAGQEYEKVWNNLGPLISRYQGEISAAEGEMKPAKERLDELQQRLEAAKKLVAADGDQSKKSTALGRLDQRQKDAITEEIERLEALISKREAEAQQARSLLEQAQTRSRDGQKAMDEEIRGQKAKLEQLAQEKSYNQSLIELEKQRADAEAGRRESDQRSARREYDEDLRILRARAEGNEQLAEQLERQKKITEEMHRVRTGMSMTEAEALAKAKERVELEEKAADAAERARKLKEARETRVDFATEIMALQLQLQGRGAMAKALREEADLRREAKEWAERDPELSEKEALRRLYLKRDLLERVNRLQEEGNRINQRGIRRYDGDMTAGGGRFINAGGGRRIGDPRPVGQGLRNAEVERRERERRANAARPEDESARILMQQMNLQERMLKIWEGMTKV